MTVIRPNSISGVTSITAHGGDITYFKSDGTRGNQFTHNVSSTGVITATKFVGPIEGNLSNGTINAASATITGNLNVGGVLTYEDVTNVDSIGIVTARLGINLVGNDLNVGSNIKIGNASGIITATSFRGDASQMTGAGLGTDGSANTSGIITATALVGDFAPRNMLINGAMQINQRGSGTLTINSSSSQYPCDRWVSRGEGGSKTFTIEKTSIASSGQGIRNALKVTSSQAASVGSSDIFNVRQMIEGYNIQRLNLGEAGCASMALSFTAYSSVAGTHSGAIQNSAQNRSYPFTYTLVANTWTDVKITIPPITSGSFNEADGVGLRVVFDLGCGNNFRGTANQWNSAQDEGATGAVRILETNGATWYVTKVQLEEGTVATKFEKKLVSEELRNCRRYYYQPLTSNNYIYGGRWGNNSTNTEVYYPVQMRATPTIGGTARRTGGTSYVGRDYFNYAVGNDDNWWENFTASAEL